MLCHARLSNFLPFLKWWPLVNRRSIQADIMAGITGAIIVLPQGVAFATIAGLPPEYGLYAAIVPTIIAALFGSSHHLISGPTTAISLVIYTTISHVVAPSTPEYISMVLTLTFIAGLFQLLLGVARLGSLINFVSHSVIIGFTAGAALLIGTSQLGNFLGVAVPKGESFLHTWIDIWHLLPQVNLFVLSIAVVTLLCALLFKIFLPRLPGMFIAMVLGSLMALILDGKSHGVRLVGSLPGHLPPLSVPDFSWSAVNNLIPGAMAVAMLGLAEAVSIARSVATRSHQHIDSNQEFIGQGLSNIIGSFFSGYASSGSFTRTGVNYHGGAKTPMAAVYAAIALVFILLLIAPLSAYLPIASMSGILLLVAYNLLDFHHIRNIIKTSRSEAAVLIVTFLSTLFVQLEFAIYIGVLLSLLLYLNRTSHPNFITLAPDPETPRHTFVNIIYKPLPECPQLKVVRVDGSLFFGAVNHIEEQLHIMTEEHPEAAHILLVGEGLNFIDVAGCEMLSNEAHDLRLNGRQLYICAFKVDVKDMMRRGGYFEFIGDDNTFHTKGAAVTKIVLEKLDPERCRSCTTRIFNECSQMPAP